MVGWLGSLEGIAAGNQAGRCSSEVQAEEPAEQLVRQGWMAMITEVSAGFKAHCETA